MENKVRISLSTHNINGFKGSEHYLKSLCDNQPNSILCLQEHWLRPTYKKIRGLNQLRMIHPLFDGYGVSAMKYVHDKSILSGRPFGGTGFVFNKAFSAFLKPLTRYESERISVMQINDSSGAILLINAYFPYRRAGDEY